MKKLFILLFTVLLITSCEDEKTIFVANHYGDCENTCLLVKDSQNDDWTNFSGTIEGFNYKEGYEYQIKVKGKRSRATAELSYKLVEIISKNKINISKKVSNIDSDWVVSNIKGFENKTNKQTTFSINNGSIFGNSGCNTFGGGINLDSGLFKTSTLRVTKMYCEDSMPLEKAFFVALSKAEKFTIKGNQLFVSDRDDNNLFVAEQKDTNKILNIQSNWKVGQLGNRKMDVNFAPYFSVENKEIQGNTGCNNFSGEIITEKEYGFVIGELHVTKMYCEKMMDLEKTFVATLNKAKYYKIENNQLLVFDEADSLLFTAFADAKKHTDVVTDSTVLEYNTYSRGLAIRNRIEQGTLKYYDIRPTKTEPTKIVLSDSDTIFFESEIEKLDMKVLENLVPPSKKHQFDEAPSATLILNKAGESVRVPTFDHGNPPMEIKAIVDRIMELRSK